MLQEVFNVNAIVKENTLTGYLNIFLFLKMELIY